MDILLGASGIVIIIAMVLLACVLWKVAKLILIPVQILLFLALMFIAYKLLFSPENSPTRSKTVPFRNWSTRRPGPLPAW